MRISKKITVVAMTAVIAASMAVPAFAGSSQVHNVDANSWSALAANDANAKREAYWNAYVQAMGGEAAALAAYEANAQAAPAKSTTKVAISQAAADIANQEHDAWVAYWNSYVQAVGGQEAALASLAQANNNAVVVAPILTSEQAAAIANATYEATH